MSKKPESTRTRHAIEVLIGSALALLFFLALLAILNRVFPDATGLGELAREQGEDAAGVRSSLDFRGVKDPDLTQIAVLTDVKRSVRDKRADSITWSAAHAGKPLIDRHAVQTSERSEATITFDRANRLQLSEKSLVVVRRPNRLTDSWNRRASVLFIDGTLRGKIGGAADDPMAVEIVAAGSSIRAGSDDAGETDFSLTVQDDGAATLSVFDGAAEIVRDDGVTVIPADHAIVFDAESFPGDFTPLPPAPALVEPVGGRTILYRSTPPEIGFRWKAVDDDTLYRLTIARDGAFEDVVHEDTVASTGFVHGNLREGAYHWQVRAFRDEAESRPSAVGRFRVLRDSEPPPLEVWVDDGAAASGRITVSGVTEPGSNVFVGETRVAVGDDGEFEHVLQIRNGYNFLVVQAIDTAGNTAFDSREIKLGSQRERS